MSDNQKGEIERRREDAETDAKRSFVARVDGWVKGLPTGWLVTGFLALTLFSWGQDSLPVVLAWLPFGSVVLGWITDSALGNIDEAILGTPWFLMGVELVRRARETDWFQHATTTAHRLAAIVRRLKG